MQLTTLMFKKTLIELVNNYLQMNLSIHVQEDKEKFMLAFTFPDFSGLWQVPVTNSLPETYLKLAESIFLNQLEILSDLEDDFLSEFAEKLSKMKCMSSRAYLDGNVEPENWENHLFNLKVELLKAKEAVETVALHKLSDIRKSRIFIDNLRGLALHYAEENYINFQLVCPAMFKTLQKKTPEGNSKNV